MTDRSREAIEDLVREHLAELAKARAEGEREGRRAMLEETLECWYMRVGDALRAGDDGADWLSVVAAFGRDLGTYEQIGRWPDEQEGD